MIDNVRTDVCVLYVVCDHPAAIIDPSQKCRHDNADYAVGCKFVWNCTDHHARTDDRLLSPRCVPKSITIWTERFELDQMQTNKLIRMQKSFDFPDSSSATIIDVEKDHVAFGNGANSQHCSR